MKYINNATCALIDIFELNKYAVNIFPSSLRNQKLRRNDAYKKNHVKCPLFHKIIPIVDKTLDGLSAFKDL